MPHDQTTGTKKEKCNSLLQLLQNHQFHASLCIKLTRDVCNSCRTYPRPPAMSTGDISCPISAMLCGIPKGFKTSPLYHKGIGVPSFHSFQNVLVITVTQAGTESGMCDCNCSQEILSECDVFHFVYANFRWLTMLHYGCCADH